MTGFLVRLFIKTPDDVGSAAVRERYGRLAAVVGVISNLLLSAAKLLIGFFSGSISIMADAVNNFSDCASSLITLIGFKMAGKPADEQHPYGHARFEYISGLVVSFLILLVGWEFLVSSIKKVMHPQPVAFSWALCAVLVFSILIKLWQGMFNRSIGKKIGSAALAATATDSRNDVIATTAVLIGAIAAQFTQLLLDGYMGILVAIFILISGVNLIRETVGPLLGMAPDKELVRAILQKIMTYESVIGTHDLVVHNYGPGRCFASVHVEVPAKQDVLISHDVIDRIERDFATQNQIELVIHLDPVVTDDERVGALRIFVAQTAKEIDAELSTHDFRMVEGPTHCNLIFDVVVPPRYPVSDAELCKLFTAKIKALSQSYDCVITIDRSYTTIR